MLLCRAIWRGSNGRMGNDFSASISQQPLKFGRRLDNRSGRGPQAVDRLGRQDEGRGL
jgi:hypothetical protein